MIENKDPLNELYMNYIAASNEFKNLKITMLKIHTKIPNNPYSDI